MKLTLYGDKAVEWLEEQFGFTKPDKIKYMKFVIQRSKDKKFYYSLVARNGRILMVSETYKRRASCTKAIASLIKQVANAEVIDKS